MIFRFVIIALLFVLNGYLIHQLNFESVDAEAYFPSSANSQTSSAETPTSKSAVDWKNKQYLFVARQHEAVLTQLKNEKLIDNFSKLPGQPKQFFVTFTKAHMNEVVARLQADDQTTNSNLKWDSQPGSELESELESASKSELSSTVTKAVIGAPSSQIPAEQTQAEQAPPAQTTPSQTTFMSPHIAGNFIADDFIHNFSQYIYWAVPFLIAFIYWLTCRAFFVRLTQELLQITLLILSAIYLLDIRITPPTILSLLFIFIYAFTLINYLHYNPSNNRTQAVSISASIFTTWMSAFLLSLSGFPVISEFGSALGLWLILMGAYLLLKTLFTQRPHYQLKWLKAHEPMKIKPLGLGLLTGLTVLALLLLWAKPAVIQLNPLLLLANNSAVKNYQLEYGNAQALSLEVHAQNCSFRQLSCQQQAHAEIEKLQPMLPVESVEAFSYAKLFESYMEMPFSEATRKEFAQFKLLMDLSGENPYLLSKDYRTQYYLLSLSMLNTVDMLGQIDQIIQKLNQQNPDFTITLSGDYGKIIGYQQLFVDELAKSIFWIFIMITLLFIALYRQLKIVVSLIPIMLSFVLMMAAHSLFNEPITIITFIAIVLFIGIVTDNIIYLLITYLQKGDACYKLIYKPVLLSNLIMITSLLAMTIFTNGILRQFGTELAGLLSLHLFFMLLLLPWLLRHFVRGNKKGAKQTA